MLERIQETAAFLKGKMHTQPETAIISVPDSAVLPVKSLKSMR